MNRDPVVLLVDDDPAITENLGAVLERSGFRVRVASDGLAALAAVTALDPDICVLDVVMPELDGREVLRPVAPRRLVASGGVVDPGRRVERPRYRPGGGGRRLPEQAVRGA